MSDRTHQKAWYAKKLTSPLWQKRRLERLEVANWTCEKCGDPFNQLHVHHEKYISGREPWEYTDAELKVLCRGCHTAEHDIEREWAVADLEARIERAYQAFVTATEDQDRRISWIAFASLKKERSPQKVKEIEFSRGLTR